MAKGVKSGGKDFPKGVSGNPKGRPPLPADLRAARILNQVEFERVANVLLGKTKAELSAILKDPSTPALVLLVAVVVRTAMWSSDPKRLDFLLTRLVGKPKPQAEPVGDEKPPASFIDLVLEAEKADGDGDD